MRLAYRVLSIMVLSVFGLASAAPVKPVKPIEAYESELGPEQFETFSKLQAEFRLMFLKELVNASDEEKEEIHKRWKEITRQHVPAHVPGSAAQFKKTWREDDLMDDGSYSAEAMFQTHDFNNDGFLSGGEIPTLYYPQLVDAYPDHNKAEDTLRELENLRMRARLLKLLDKDNDGKISLSEFTAYHPNNNADYDWLDEDDLPDLDDVKDDKILIEAVRKDLEMHPNDTASEELMHRIYEKPAISEKPALNAYSVHNAGHAESHPQPIPVSPHVPSHATPTAPKPSVPSP